MQTRGEIYQRIIRYTLQGCFSTSSNTSSRRSPEDDCNEDRNIDLTTLHTPAVGLGVKKSPVWSGDQNTWQSSRIWWTTLTIFFLDAILVSLLMVRVRVIDGVNEGYISELLEDSPFCLPCSEVYPTYLEELQNRFQVHQQRDPENQTKLCCSNQHDLLHTLIGRMYLRTRHSRDKANEVNGTFSVPLALRLMEDDAKYTNHSIMLQKAGVKVAQAGLYYIFSRIPFTFNTQQPKFMQFVYRKRSENELMLLENSVYPCVPSAYNCQDSFVGGVFHLKEEDEIYVRVSDYRGLEKLSEMQFCVHLI